MFGRMRALVASAFALSTIGGCSSGGASHPVGPARPSARPADPPHVSKAGQVVYNVDASELEALRVSGEKFVMPDDQDQVHLNGQRIVGSFKLCLDETGHYEQGTILRSTGLASYDAKIARTLMQWVFKPYVLDGAAIPVCSAFSFIYTQ